MLGPPEFNWRSYIKVNEGHCRVHEPGEPNDPTLQPTSVAFTPPSLLHCGSPINHLTSRFGAPMFEISPKFFLLSSQFFSSNQVTSLYMPRQLSCPGMCKIMTWSDDYCWYYSAQHFYCNIWIMSSLTVCKMGLPITHVTAFWEAQVRNHPFSVDKHINGLVQKRHNSCALAIELHLSSTNPSRCCCESYSRLNVAQGQQIASKN